MSIRRLAVAAALLVLVGLTGCGRTPIPLPDVPQPAPTRLDGTLFFLGSGPDAGELWGLAGGTRFRLVRNTDAGFYQTATVSPDGTRYAWISGGQLRLAAFDDPPTAVGGTDLDASFTPQWTTDGTALLVRYDTTRYGRIDIASGDVTPLPEAPYPYAAFSANDGAFSIYGDVPREEWTIAELGPDGATTPIVKPPFRHYTRFQSIAPDGRHAVTLLRGFTEPRPEENRILAANAIVDVTTGTVQRIPGGGTLRQGFFRADGGAVLRVSEGLADRVLLISPQGEVVDRVDLPAGVTNLSLLAYQPASTPAPQTPTPQPPPPVTLDGTLFLLGADRGLHTLRDGTLARVTDRDDPAFVRTVAVSPEGTHYAWIALGQLHVAAVAGDAVAVGPSSLDGSFVPVWLPDGAGVAIRYETLRYGRIDPSSGTITPYPLADDPYLAISPDGAFAVAGFRDTAGRTVVRIDGDPSPVPVVAPDGRQIVSFTSLSPDGHHALVLLIDEDEQAPTPVLRALTATAIVDLSGGAVVPVPSGGTLREGFFRPDGTLVLRVTSPAGTDSVVLLSRTGEVLDRLELPADAADLSLVAYAASS